MESKINYTIVGLFVVILMTALLSITFWLTRQHGQQSYDTYFVHLLESVAGLNTDATVKYRGVDVGSVVRIGLKVDNPEVVELLIKINQNTAIKTDTTAALNFYGITGLAYIELEGIDKEAALLKSVNGEIPVIPSRPSTLRRIDQSLSKLAEKSIETLENINRLLNDKNINNVELLLFESKELLKDLRVQLKGIRTLVDNGVVMENKIAATSEKISAASISVQRMADNLEKNTTGLSQEMSRGMHANFSALNLLLSDLDILTGTLQTTLQDIKDSPADLLFKRTQANPGPGEDGYYEK
ncbi:Mammalian cell entry related domain protein [Psychromonas ingrahamii 37]|uniref:Mammalian cell entry related domain protein n=1 Tax=Psychromonas ingrahamii (strain DSM 17664 / CCUG 51855 / 37) TaxID=357804 RepID=A1SVF6_PSYIN|nr:MlaD family protein [Psychromonas ingrahamii]ABM03471.1 Mammalian cell entry related domain protein [Psychromonas ingrahamii 37]